MLEVTCAYVRPADDEVADSGFWDAFNTVYPFLSLVFPDVLGRIMEGWVRPCVYLKLQ